MKMFQGIFIFKKFFWLKLDLEKIENDNKGKITEISQWRNINNGFTENC
jgi:hypothetical protein